MLILTRRVGETVMIGDDSPRRIICSPAWLAIVRCTIATLAASGSQLRQLKRFG
jgi:hypothetical protein